MAALLGEDQRRYHDVSSELNNYFIEGHHENNLDIRIFSFKTPVALKDGLHLLLKSI